MYDWPEVHDAVDALWSAIADCLRAAGIDAPRLPASPPPSVRMPIPRPTLPPLTAGPPAAGPGAAGDGAPKGTAAVLGGGRCGSPAGAKMDRGFPCARGLPGVGVTDRTAGDAPR